MTANDPLSEPWDPDAPLLERLIARGPVIAVLVGMIVLWARLISLWLSGTIKTTPFFGSTGWNLAIVLPVVAIFAARYVIMQRRIRRRDHEVSGLMPSEPLAGWHRRIRGLDEKLEHGTPSHAVDMEIWQLTLAIVDAYAKLDAKQRQHVRLLWRTYKNFGLYASVEDRLETEKEEEESRTKPFTVEQIRRELLLISIRDQYPDARDAAWDLADLRTRAAADGIDFGALAREVAALSDDTRRDAMFGSTREVMLRYV